MGRRPRRHHPGCWPFAQPGLRHWSPILRHVLLLHQSGPCSAGLLKNWKETKAYKNDVYLLPKELDEKVARFHLPLGANLTTLSKEQADYIGVKIEGPFKG